MDDPGGIARQAASELAQLRRRIAELEASESRQQAADSIDRQRAEGDILQRAQLSALGAAVGLALTHANSLAGALQECTEALVTFMDAAFARVWTLNEREGVLELQASAGLYTHLNGPHGRVPLGQLKIGRIARDRKPLLTNAVIGDPEVSDQEWARRERMVAFAGHPLIVDDRVLGVIGVFSRHALSDAVLPAMASVATQIALGIDRGRSTEALEHNVRRDITSQKRVAVELKRLNDEIQLQRLQVFKSTMRTVQDIVNNLLNGLQLLHLEAEGHVPAETLEVVERMIREAAVKLKTLGDLETVIEKDNGFGLGIDYPGSTL